MSVLVPSLTNNHHHYFPNRRINGNLSQLTKHMSITNRLTTKLNENTNGDSDNDQVPFGVVNSMKQRLLDKVNESLLSNTNCTLIRHSLTKTSSRISSNENLLQAKLSLSPLKRTTRLSRSQDNLLNNNVEQFSSYLQPKQDVIIVDTTPNDEHDEKISTHRHSYTELHVDEVPKPGTVTTVKNMFERQIRLSRYDTDKLPNTSIPINSRVNSQHREVLSPTRSRSISPNDMALRLRRATIPGPVLPTTLLLPVPTSYPDLVISHTPPTSSHIETNKILIEQSVINIYNENKKKDISLNIAIDEATNCFTANHYRPNLLLPSTSSSDIVDYQPLDFKSRLALFNRTNIIERSNENSHIPTNIKKPSNQHHSVPSPPNFLTKPVVHHHLEKKDIPIETINNQIARSVVNTAKAVTFFGGTKLNGNSKSSLPTSIEPPPITKEEPSPLSPSTDSLRAPDVVGGNVKLNKSSIFSGAKKDVRVQFIDNVDSFEYPSFDVVMAELGSSGSDDDDPSSNDDNNHRIKKNSVGENINDDVDDDELERLARINANFNSNNLTEKSLQPKGTLHTFRPTHLDQYELGTQHDSLKNFNSSDIPREKFLSLSNNFSNHSILKQQKSTFDISNNVQWSSMSTTTDLLF